MDGLLPFGGDGVAFWHGHGGILQKHLRASAAAPGQEIDEMILADRLGACGRVGVGFAILNTAANVVHGEPRVMGLSMPDGLPDFQPV